MQLRHVGCVHKLDLVDPGYEPAVRKLPEINLPVSGLCLRTPGYRPGY